MENKCLTVLGMLPMQEPKEKELPFPSSSPFSVLFSLLLCPTKNPTTSANEWGGADDYMFFLFYLEKTYYMRDEAKKVTWMHATCRALGPPFILTPLKIEKTRKFHFATSGADLFDSQNWVVRR